MKPALQSDKSAASASTVALCARSTVIYGGFAISPAPAAPAIGVRVRSNNPGGAIVRMTPQGDMSILHGPGKRPPEMIFGAQD